MNSPKVASVVVEETQHFKDTRDAARYRKIRDRISTSTLSMIALSEPRPSEDYGKKIDDIVDQIR